MSLVGPGTLTEYDGGPSRGRRQRGSVRVQKPAHGYAIVLFFSFNKLVVVSDPSHSIYHDIYYYFRFFIAGNKHMRVMVPDIHPSSDKVFVLYYTSNRFNY
jgi:hypothetical protein